MVRTCIPVALLCAVLMVPASHANADQPTKNAQPKSSTAHTAKTAPTNRVPTKTAKPIVRAASRAPKPAPKDMPPMKGDSVSCIALVRDLSGNYLTPFYRARNSCARRIRLWVFDIDNKLWLDSIILEPKEDASDPVYDGMLIDPGQFVAACAMTGDTTPPGCFSKAAGGRYSIASINVILR